MKKNEGVWSVQNTIICLENAGKVVGNSMLLLHIALLLRAILYAYIAKPTFLIVLFETKKLSRIMY